MVVYGKSDCGPCPWVEKFLKDRKQRVACEGMNSDWTPVISGVPQGSVIAPILFLIYINDLPNNLKSTVRLFAGDTIIYMTISNGTDATALQQDLDTLCCMMLYILYYDAIMRND